jgi:hypothetical protein
MKNHLSSPANQRIAIVQFRRTSYPAAVDCGAVPATQVNEIIRSYLHRLNDPMTPGHGVIVEYERIAGLSPNRPLPPGIENQLLRLLQLRDSQIRLPYDQLSPPGLRQNVIVYLF